jgi:hypothetical protein
VTDAFEVLAQDHAKVKEMLAQLEMGALHQGAVGTEQLAQRKELTEQLVIEESKHEAVEEMYFWPAVRQNLAGGDQLADTAIAQEQEGKEVLDKLDKLDAGHPEFEKLLADFIRAARSGSARDWRTGTCTAAPRSRTRPGQENRPRQAAAPIPAPAQAPRSTDHLLAGDATRRDRRVRSAAVRRGISALLARQPQAQPPPRTG